MKDGIGARDNRMNDLGMTFSRAVLDPEAVIAQAVNSTSPRTGEHNELAERDFPRETNLRSIEFQFGLEFWLERGEVHRSSVTIAD